MAHDRGTCKIRARQASGSSCAANLALTGASAEPKAPGSVSFPLRMANSIPQKGKTFPTENSGGRTVDRTSGFRVIYAAIFAFAVLYVFSVEAAELLLSRHFDRTVAAAVQVDPRQRTDRASDPQAGPRGGPALDLDRGRRGPGGRLRRGRGRHADLSLAPACPSPRASTRKQRPARQPASCPFPTTSASPCPTTRWSPSPS